MSNAASDAATRVTEALDGFKIELPSWGFADTGTRFGKFRQDAAAFTTEHKFADAGLVNKLTGCCPTVAVHVLWDFESGEDPSITKKIAEKNGVAVGSINPNVFQDQAYKLGSFCSPFKESREAAIKHTLDCVKIGNAVGSTLMSMWLADGTNYPGQDNLRARKKRLEEGFTRVLDTMRKDWPTGTMLIEYKPFEPAFYHTDIADWGMSAAFCAAIGGMKDGKAKVLVDTGHHLPGANIEHIVAFLLDEDLLGGFHFNDRKYADDDLTMSSIDPYAVFRIFDQIAQYQFDTGKTPDIAYMVDQSHNLKPKLEAMVQTVCEAQKFFAKAFMVDRKKLADFQSKGDIVGAETTLRDAYESDVTPILAKWRKAKGLPEDPLKALREGGYISKLGAERKAQRESLGMSSGDSAYA